MADVPEHAAPSWRDDFLSILGPAAIGLAVALLFRILAWQPYTIPSSSMEPGLVTGDYILVSKFAYGWSRASLPFSPPVFEGRILGQGPGRGEVVVFRDNLDPGKTLIKRVVGLPGDRVQVRGGQLWVNGTAVPRLVRGAAPDRDDPHANPTRVDERGPDGRPYATFDRGPGHPGDDTPVMVVPAGRYFMMGDNRDNSLDSRWPEGVGVGFVAAENIVGRADLVLASWRPGAGLLKPWRWLDLQWDRFFRPIR